METARQIGVDEDPKALDRAFSKVMPNPRQSSSTSDAMIRPKIRALLLGALPDISQVICENMYRGEGEGKRLVEQRITLHVKCALRDQPDR